MAIYEQQQQQHVLTTAMLDELYCEEETWELINKEEHEVNNNVVVVLNEQDMFWEDEELTSLFAKEKVQQVPLNLKEMSLSCCRKEAVEWILRVNSCYGFCGLTSILSVNYFDRCVSSVPFVQQHHKPWTFQLLAVACVSLAAKVEETHVPLILDLQVEGARVVFEPKDVQKMELLVLTTLDWKMHPVTPISFIDHIIRRLGLNHQLHWEFLNKCETVLLSLLSDWRYERYLPSVLATATMMHVIDQIQPCDPLPYHFQLLHLLNFTKEKVKDCYDLIVETSILSNKMDIISKCKRRFDQMMMMNNFNSYTNTRPSSPSGVMDAYWFSSDSSNDSWASTSTTNNVISGGRLSVSSSPVTSRKKGRVHEQPMTLQLPSLSRVFVDVIESPR